MDGVNKVGSLFLGPQIVGIPRLSSTLTHVLGSLVYLTQPMIYAGEVQGLLPSFLGNLQNLQIFSYDQNQISDEGVNLANIRKTWSVNPDAVEGPT
jgi:Leucine-rich repeat (LRR) protein